MLWADGKAAESRLEAAPEPAETPARYCQDHRTAFKRHSRGHIVWHAHRLLDGKWCREK